MPDDMYQQILMRHSRNSSFRVDLRPEEADVVRRNTSCGDELWFVLATDSTGMLHPVFNGQACAIALAGASMACELLENFPQSGALRRVQTVIDFLNSDHEWDEDWGKETIPALGAVRKFPMRIPCARLAWDALQSALTS